jgi:hypothetical protein
MNVDEESVRDVLTRIAADPEPPARVDLDVARRRGRRRVLFRHAAQAMAGPLAIALAVCVIVTVPRALSTGTERLAPSAPARSPAQTATEPKSAPASFNPLVPYAAFGWLPGGFSEGAVSLLWGPFQSGTTSLALGAQDAKERTLLLTVNTRSACQLSTSPEAASASCVIRTSVPGVSRAPDINGRPAWYVGWGASIDWEYAPDAWASLDAGVSVQLPGKATSTAAQGPADAAAQESAVRAAEQGWVLSPAPGKQASVPRPGGTGSAKVDVSAEINDGQLIPPSAQTKAILRRAATLVEYGQKTPIVFPFRLSALSPPAGALPPGWQLSSVSFWPSGGRLAGTGISAGPAADTSALSASASAPDGYGCNFVTGQSSYVTRYGVSWIDRVIGQVNKDVESLCSTGSRPSGLVDGLQVFIYLEENNPGSNSLLPGVKSLSGAFGVYSRMTFLGSDPSGWTTDPLG